MRSVKNETANPNLHFFHCDVTDWQSQVQFFKNAIKFSPHGGIDTVIANAGITDATNQIESPQGLDVAEPSPPSLAVLDVNLRGVVYTTHLALYYLPRNPKSPSASPDCNPSQISRDRHLLLLSSMAGLSGLPGNSLYAASKHGVVGLFRSLRATSFIHGVRINMLCPYFVDTPMFITAGRLMLASGVMGKTQDVVEAGTRFVADPRICGRAITVGPKMKVKQQTDGNWELVEGDDEAAEDKVLWEPYADDFEDSELFTRNITKLLNRQVEIRGWIGWFSDVFAALRNGLGWS